jgi:zinc transport system ATP-binding protein
MSSHTPSSQPLITVSDLSFRYRADHPIFEGISLSIHAGEYIGIIGPNGSGKSTFLKLLLGLLPLQTGNIELFGKPIEQFKEWEKIGYVPQKGFEGEPNFPATVEEVIAAGYPFKSFLPNKEERKKLREKIDTITDIVGIRHLLKRRIGELSGGEEQRAFIAQALLSDPLLLVLDEPTAGIDLATEESFYGLLKRLNEEHGKTILLVSHDLEALAHHSKTALCLNRKVVYHGPAEGLHEPKVVEAVFGSQAWHRHQ